MGEKIRMRALSLQQPWANLVAEGRKTLETRKWQTPYRGDILIISSRKPAITPAGYALAIVRLVHIRKMVREDENAACISLYPGAYAWELEDLRVVEPFPMKGSLGLFWVEVDKDLIKT
jgi:hypothetical protein